MPVTRISSPNREESGGKAASIGFSSLRERALDMQKIVINTSFDKFCLSHEAFLRLRELGQQDALQEIDQAAYWPTSAAVWEPQFNQCGMSISRDDEKLIRVVEELKEKANGHCASLKIVSIPEGVAWQISMADGIEHVSEIHRTWR
jgi:hypothetical protein